MKRVISLFCFFIIAIFTISASADIILFDGDAIPADYQHWWGTETNRLVNTNYNPRSGTYCGKWTEPTGWGGGAHVTAGWSSVDISYMTNFEFWARTDSGSGHLEIVLFESLSIG